jgi:hypothetical protein
MVQRRIRRASLQCRAMQASVRRSMVALWTGARNKAGRAHCKIDSGPHEALVRHVSIELRREHSSESDAGGE